jgi:hypothetical protein
MNVRGEGEEEGYSASDCDGAPDPNRDSYRLVTFNHLISLPCYCPAMVMATTGPHKGKYSMQTTTTATVPLHSRNWLQATVPCALPKSALNANRPLHPDPCLTYSALTS